MACNCAWCDPRANQVIVDRVVVVRSWDGTPRETAWLARDTDLWFCSEDAREAYVARFEFAAMPLYNWKLAPAFIKARLGRLVRLLVR